MSAAQKVWKSGSWVDITSGNSDFVFFSPNIPPNPKIGDLWYDDNDGVKLLKVWNGLDWMPISSAIYSVSLPSANSTGQLWFDSVNQSLSIWSGTAWIEIGKKSDDANNILANQVFR